MDNFINIFFEIFLIEKIEFYCLSIVYVKYLYIESVLERNMILDIILLLKYLIGVMKGIYSVFWENILV